MSTAVKLECVSGHRLCTPKFYAGPSGPALRHNWKCPARPGERIDLNEYAQGRTGEPWRKKERRW